MSKAKKPDPIQVPLSMDQDTARNLIAVASEEVDYAPAKYQSHMIHAIGKLSAGLYHTEKDTDQVTINVGLQDMQYLTLVIMLAERIYQMELTDLNDAMADTALRGAIAAAEREREQKAQQAPPKPGTSIH